MRRTAYIIGAIGVAMILLGIINILVKGYIDKKCETTTDIDFFVRNCDYKQEVNMNLFVLWYIGMIILVIIQQITIFYLSAKLGSQTTAFFGKNKGSKK